MALNSIRYFTLELGKLFPGNILANKLGPFFWLVDYQQKYYDPVNVLIFLQSLKHIVQIFFNQLASCKLFI